MMYDINPIYHEQSVKKYKGNPLIEALPIVTKTDYIKLFENLPEVNNDDRNLDYKDRIITLKNTINEIRIALPYHINLFEQIDTNLKMGYSNRNPFSKENIEKQNAISLLCKGESENLIENKTDVVINSSNTPAPTIMVAGASGCGKTTSVSQVLQNYPQVIRHSEYNGELFAKTQIVYLNVLCNPDMTTKMFLLKIMGSIDAIKGTSYVAKYYNKNSTIVEDAVKQLLSNNYVGMIIIDEVQELLVSKSGREKVIDFLTTFLSEIYVPIVFITTPKFFKIVKNECRLLRRVSTNLMLLRPLKNKSYEWERFISSIWKYQFTKNYVELTQEIKDKMFEYTQGIIDLALTMFISVQCYAIINNKEKIDIKIIDYIYKTQFIGLAKILQIMKIGNRDLLESEIDDIYLPDVDEIIAKIGLDNQRMQIKKTKP